MSGCRHFKDSSYLHVSKCIRTLKRVKCGGGPRKGKIANKLPYLCLGCGELCLSIDFAKEHGNKHGLFVSLVSKEIVCTKCRKTKGRKGNDLGIIVEANEKIDNFFDELEVWLETNNPVLLVSNSVKEKKKKKNKEGDINGIIVKRVEDLEIVDKIVEEKGEEMKKGRIYPLINIGNTCFMNSIIQVLAQTSGLVEELGKFVANNEEENNEYSSSLFNMIQATRYGNVVGAGVEKVHPRSVYGNIMEKAPQLGGFGQQDAHELLIEIFRALEEDENVKEHSYCWHLFSAEMSRTVTCLNCKTKTIRVEESVVASLDCIEGNLQKCIDETHQKHHLLESEGNGFDCETCSRSGIAGQAKLLRDCMVSEDYTRPPQVFILHMKRFETKFKNGQVVSTKKQTPVTFEQVEEFSFNGTFHTYTLYGVVVHRGKSLNSGHYICYTRPYVKDAQGFVTRGDWWYGSDSIVKQVNDSQVLGDQAYLLFYELS